MKKFFCKLLVLCLILSGALMLVSCDENTADTEPTAAATTTRTPAATTEVTAEPNPTPEMPEELTVWTAQLATVEDFETNRFTAFYEKLTGIHVNWITANHTERETKLNLSLSSGEYPDIYTTWFSQSQIVDYGVEAGIFIPLNDLIDKYAPNFAAILNADPALKERITAPDGNIYGFTGAAERDNVSYEGYSTPFKLWVFKPWLEKSELGMPETLDKLKELLVYFRDHDMNGNGDTNDEIPMIGTYQYCHEGSDPMYAIMECFQYMTPTFTMADKDGNFSFLANTDSYREGLQYVHELYNEGLFAEETYVQDLNQYRALVNVTTADDMVVGVAAGPVFARFVTQSIYADAYNDFETIPCLSETTYFLSHCGGTTLCPTVTSSCKYPEAAVMWIDAAFDPEVNLTMNIGFENEQWTRVGESEENGIEYMMTDTPLIPQGASTQNNVWQNWTIKQFNSIKVPTYTQIFKEGTNLGNQKQKAANSTYEAVAVESGIPIVVWSTDVDLNNERAELAMQIEDYVKQSYAEFILGTRDIDDDAAWQTYLDELNAMGLERYLEVCKEYYFGE